MMHWQGLTDLTGASYTPIGLVNADPAGLQVRADSPYKTVKDLVDAIKANPGKFKASGTGQGGIWHLALAGMLKDLKIDPAAAPWVPSQRRRARPAGHGGRRRRDRAVLAARGALADRRRQGAEPGDHGRQRRPALYPERADAEVADRQRLEDGRLARHRRAQGHARRTCATTLVAAIKKVDDSKEYKDFMASRGFGVIYLPPDEFAKFMAKSTPTSARR